MTKPDALTIAEWERHDMARELTTAVEYLQRAADRHIDATLATQIEKAQTFIRQLIATI